MKILKTSVLLFYYNGLPVGKIFFKFLKMCDSDQRGSQTLLPEVATLVKEITSMLWQITALLWNCDVIENHDTETLVPVSWSRCYFAAEPVIGQN